MAPKRFYAAALAALREALTHIYWYKPDQRRFLCQVLDGCSVLGGVNWDAYKRQISDQIVTTLSREANRYALDLERLFLETAAMEDFSTFRNSMTVQKKRKQQQRLFARSESILLDTNIFFKVGVMPSNGKRKANDVASKASLFRKS